MCFAAASVDYEDWIKRRLQIAAATRRRQAAAGQPTNFSMQQSAVADAAPTTAAAGPDVPYITSIAAAMHSGELQHQ